METNSPLSCPISRNLIYLLSIDARQSISQLSRILNENRKIVENRVKKLYEKGYVKPLLIVNEKEMLSVTILLKLNKIDSTIIQKIKQIKNLLKLKEILGNYDLSILCEVRSQQDVDDLISNLSKLLHGTILSFDVLIHRYEDTLGYKYFCEDFNLLTKYNHLSQQKKSFSKDVRENIDYLRKNPSSTLFRQSKETRVPFKKLKKIISDSLEDKSIRFSIDPDYDKLGLEFHNILIKINPAEKEKFEKYILAHPHIHWVKHCSGRWDYVLSLVAKDMNEFVDLSREIRNNNKNVILEENTLVSKIMVKRRY